MKLPDNAHIAVLRLSALGDVTHVISVVSAIQKRYPHTKITWITGKHEAQLVSMMPNVNVVIYDKKTGIKGMLALRRQMKKYAFDVLLHMQWSIRASVLSLMIKAKTRIGFCRRYSREKQHWFVNHLAPEPSGKHVLDALMSMALAIDVPNEPPFWMLKPAIFALADEKLSLPSDYIVINPSASKPIRNWTLAGYRQVIEFLIRHGQHVVLTGGPSEQEISFATEIANGLSVINLVGKTDLHLLTSVIAKAKLIVSPDTGPAHIGTMVGTPVLGLYALSNPERTGPYLSKDLMVSVYSELAEKEYGKPIEEIPWAARVHDENAMDAIQVEDVIAKLIDFTER
ncbi:lipopolysaccharide heptosyltransferase family protein [Marinomonas agarivorans]|nr:lipopolysaccharide heptosyltransferase family protein [Marinomonas agarivorans]